MARFQLMKTSCCCHNLIWQQKFCPNFLSSLNIGLFWRPNYQQKFYQNNPHSLILSLLLCTFTMFRGELQEQFQKQSKLCQKTNNLCPCWMLLFHFFFMHFMIVFSSSARVKKFSSESLLVLDLGKSSQDPNLAQSTHVPLENNCLR